MGWAWTPHGVKPSRISSLRKEESCFGRLVLMLISGDVDSNVFKICFGDDEDTSCIYDSCLKT